VLREAYSERWRTKDGTTTSCRSFMAGVVRAAMSSRTNDGNLTHLEILSAWGVFQGVLECPGDDIEIPASQSGTI
jgi:hypothetical protein